MGGGGIVGLVSATTYVPPFRVPSQIIQVFRTGKTTSTIVRMAGGGVSGKLTKLAALVEKTFHEWRRRQNFRLAQRWQNLTPTSRDKNKELPVLLRNHPRGSPEMSILWRISGWSPSKRGSQERGTTYNTEDERPWFGCCFKRFLSGTWADLQWRNYCGGSLFRSVYHLVFFHHSLPIWFADPHLPDIRGLQLCQQGKPRQLKLNSAAVCGSYLHRLPSPPH